MVIVFSAIRLDCQHIVSKRTINIITWRLLFLRVTKFVTLIIVPEPHYATASHKLYKTKM